MRRFKGRTWTDEIAELSTRPEFQNSTIRVLDPSVTGTYDIETGKWEYDEDENFVIYEGRARIRDVRWGVYSGGESQFNTKSISNIRVQVPKEAMPHPPKGAPVEVLECSDNSGLVGTLFLVTDGFQGGAQASRTFEAAVDSDAEK